MPFSMKIQSSTLRAKYTDIASSSHKTHHYTPKTISAHLSNGDNAFTKLMSNCSHQHYLNQYYAHYTICKTMHVSAQNFCSIFPSKTNIYFISSHRFSIHIKVTSFHFVICLVSNTTFHKMQILTKMLEDARLSLDINTTYKKIIHASHVQQLNPIIQVPEKE